MSQNTMSSLCFLAFPTNSTLILVILESVILACTVGTLLPSRRILLASNGATIDTAVLCPSKKDTSNRKFLDCPLYFALCTMALIVSSLGVPSSPCSTTKQIPFVTLKGRTIEGIGYTRTKLLKEWRFFSSPSPIKMIIHHFRFTDRSNQARFPCLERNGFSPNSSTVVKTYRSLAQSMRCYKEQDFSTYFQCERKNLTRV